MALLAIALLATGVAAFIRTGIYDIGADDPHYPATYAVLEQLREASIARRASKLTVPADLMGEARIRQGAGNYDAMCKQCHLAPGMDATELSKGLYPAPPDLSKTTVDAAEAFWTIKHGIKASGMPAWGGSMDDAYIWNMAAFVRRLPDLDADAYAAIVAASGGHAHGGGETGAAMDHHGTPAGLAASTATEGDSKSAPGHPHPPGTPVHRDPPAHVDPPGTKPHSH